MKITRNQFVTREKLDLAKDLRKRMTPQEKILWSALRKDAFNQLHFRRQQVIAGYVVDFYCASAKLAIEIDGAAHLNTIEYYAIRDRALAEIGIRTFRIRNQEVDEHLQKVKKNLRSNLSPNPSPFRRGEPAQEGQRTMMPLRVVGDFPRSHSLPPLLKGEGARGRGNA